MTTAEELSKSFEISAAGCDAARRLPPSTLVADIIDLAVAHADKLGVGYAAMAPHGIMWVMGRLSIEAERWPVMFDHYTLTTWVTSVNRMMSERDFELTIDGRPAGYARTIWSAIDSDTRQAALLTPVTGGLDVAVRSDRVCPVSRAPRLGAPAEPDSTRSYTFGLSDLDFNRHVTTTHYVDLIIDTIPLDLYDRCSLRRIDLAFHREARYADTVDIVAQTDTADDGSTVITAAITAAGNHAEVYCAGRILLIENN